MPFLFQPYDNCCVFSCGAQVSAGAALGWGCPAPGLGLGHKSWALQAAAGSCPGWRTAALAGDVARPLLWKARL